MNLIVLMIFSTAQLIAAEPTSSLYNDVELTTDTIRLTSIPSMLIPKLTTNFGALKPEEPHIIESSAVQSVPAAQNISSNANPAEPSVNRTGELVEPVANRTEEFSEDLKRPTVEAVAFKENHQNENQPIEENPVENHVIASKPVNGYTITALEIRKTNQTLLSTIVLRVHSILQYSSNFSRRAVIPYVYMAKLQADGLYRQIVDSTFLQNYASNVFQTLVNDVMNQECNAFSELVDRLFDGWSFGGISSQIDMQTN